MKSVPIQIDNNHMFTAIVKLTQEGVYKVHTFIPGLGRCPNVTESPYGKVSFSSIEELKKQIIDAESSVEDQQG